MDGKQKVLEGPSRTQSSRRVAKASSRVHSHEPERRQLTVVFCDVVDSTVLSGQLDPEDLREVIQAFQSMCGDVVRRFEGSIAQYLGDGILIYFGYPVAHEDDGMRAANASLAIVEALADLNEQLEQSHHVRLAVRIGIHTGLVVVGEVGTRDRRERLALGETPNIAARLQNAAAPNTIVTSETTVQLLRDAFDIDDLGARLFKGISTPTRMYRVVRAREYSSPPSAPQRRLTPLAGRDEELHMLLKLWQQTRDGTGQAVVLSGEAGIGKSRLIQTIKASVAHEPHELFECWGSPHHWHAALTPIATLFHGALGWRPGDSSRERLGKLENALASHRLPVAELVPLFAEVLSLPVPGHRPLAVESKLHHRRMLEALLTMLLGRAVDRPVLFIVEDADRLDALTLEFVSLLIERASSARMLLLLSCRRKFPIPWSLVMHLKLPRLALSAAERIITSIAGEKPLPRELRLALLAKADGVPLFLEEIARTVLESGLLREEERGYVLTRPVDALAIPVTLQDSLTARLDRLGPAKEIAQWGAVIGYRFSHDLLQALLPYDASTLERRIAHLVRGEIVFRQEGVYTFRHSLIHEAAYQSLLRAVRRTYHERVARVIQALRAKDLESHVLDIAHHLISAGPIASPHEVLDYSRRAGNRARALFGWRAAAYYDTAALSADERSASLDPRERAELHYLAGSSFYREGDVRRCTEHYGEAIRLYRLAADSRGVAQVLVKKVYVTAAGSYGAPVDLRPLEDVLRQLGDSDLRLSAHVLIALAEAYWVARQPGRAERMANRALELGRRLRDNEIQWRANFDVAVAQMQNLDLREALKSLERTRRYARRSNNVWFEGWPLQRMPSVFFQLGRLDAAARVADAAREFAARTNNWAQHSLATGVLTCRAVAKGEFLAAARIAGETMDLVAQYHFPFGGAMALPAIACAHALRGLGREAERALDMLMEPGTVFENPEPSFGPITAIYHRLIRRYIGMETGPGRASVTRLLTGLRTDRFDVTSVAPYCALVELSAGQKASRTTAHLYARLSSACEEGVVFSRGWVFCVPRVLGVAATINGHWRRAETHFCKAVRITARVGAGPELGLTCLDYAGMLHRRHGRGDRARARDLLSKASEIFEAFGMGRFLERAAKLSDDLTV